MVNNLSPKEKRTFKHALNVLFSIKNYSIPKIIEDCKQLGFLSPHLKVKGREVYLGSAPRIALGRATEIVMKAGGLEEVGTFNDIWQLIKSHLEMWFEEMLIPDVDEFFDRLLPALAEFKKARRFIYRVEGLKLEDVDAIELGGKTIAASHAELELLRVANATLKLESTKRQASSGGLVENFQKLVKDIAKEAAGRDPEFVTIIDRLLLNETLPNEFVKQLERKLRKHLNTDDRTLSLHDLIMMAKDAELLTEKGIDIAHTLRKHRNILTHESTDPRTHVARVLFCLFAAALLWPEFSK